MTSENFQPDESDIRPQDEPSVPRSQPKRQPAPTGPGGQPLASRDAAHGRGLIVGLAVVVALGGWILWNAAKAATTKPKDVKLGSGFVEIFKNEKEMAKRVEKDGPGLYPGLGGTEADFWLNSVNGQWFAFAARPKGTGRECNINWQADVGQFSAPCENGKLYGPTGKGLQQYEVIVEDGTVAVNLAK